ncbi:MAG TPA: UPF0175 family protein [Candidatus Nanoarchaeia archaeon]|nr:UPF0175 family protein [Candidatus Nanoarchaeia archaeon]
MKKNQEMLVTVSTRMDKESLDYIKKISRKFQIDKSTALRKLLKKGVEEDKKESAIELYRKGELSLEGAVKFADLYIGEFLEVLREEGIELNLTMKDYESGLKNLKKIWK